MHPITKKSLIREPAMADRFYPAKPTQLKQSIEDCIGDAKQYQPVGKCPKAVVAPHAGYIYSGPIAASAMAPLALEKSVIRRIVLIGPSHRVPFQGLAIPSAEVFATPLGKISIDTESLASLLALNQVQILDNAHAQEHSLEVELPFLQVLLDTFTLVPIIVGEATDLEVANAIETVWGGEETRFIISSDLSHYLPYDDAMAIDRKTAHAVESLQPESICDNQACGRTAIRGLLIAAQRRKMRSMTVDLRNSGDTAGSRDRVVGYGAFAMYS